MAGMDFQFLGSWCEFKAPLTGERLWRFGGNLRVLPAAVKTPIREYSVCYSVI
jgi:hypothetical protein